MAAAPEHLWHTLPHHYVNTHDAGCATSPFYFYLPSTGQVGVKKKKNLSCNPSLQEAEGNNCLKAGAVCLLKRGRARAGTVQTPLRSKSERVSHRGDSWQFTVQQFVALMITQQ